MSSAQPGPDLFGYIELPSSPKQRRVVRRSRDRHRLEVLDAELGCLSEQITDLIWDIRLEIVGLVDDGREVEIDFLLDGLDEELTEAVGRLRWGHLP